MKMQEKSVNVVEPGSWIRLASLACGLLVAVQAVAAQSVQIDNERDTVEARYLHLRGLDTLNGTTRDIDLEAGGTIRYGYLEITADACRIPREDPSGDAYAFLRIRDLREEAPRFSGWMFASSPAVSALDHPRYDVWLLSCSNR
jgi:hypothetical protein